jgi:SAM-dependent methyltransferase
MGCFCFFWLPVHCLQNIDRPTVEHFGAEWDKFDQRDLPQHELERLFEAYFSVFPWEQLPHSAEGFDVGCGSGRWAAFVAARVGRLHCIDASERALAIARRNLKSLENCDFYAATFDDLPLTADSMDFGYCLGVLHHVPYPEAALRACVSRLKPGAPLLLYIYYALDNRPWWFRALWRVTDAIRRRVCSLPPFSKRVLCDCIAALVYFPLARMALLCEQLGIAAHNFPVYMYRRLSFYVMRNDALDRFGTPLEKRMSKVEIEALMRRCGLIGVQFNVGPPFWCAVGFRDRMEPHTRA